MKLIKRIYVGLMGLALLVPMAMWATDTHILVQDSGSARARTKSYTRTSDAVAVQMQLFQESWLEMDFGASAAGAGNQIFNEATASTTSAAIAVNGSNLANYLAVTCECDDSDVDFNLRPGYRHYNATDKVGAGSIIPFDNSMGTISGFTTLETSFRHAGTAVVATLGAKEVLFRLTINAGATPRVSCWYSRL